MKAIADDIRLPLSVHFTYDLLTSDNIDIEEYKCTHIPYNLRSLNFFHCPHECSSIFLKAIVFSFLVFIT